MEVGGFSVNWSILHPAERPAQYPPESPCNGTLVSTQIEGRDGYEEGCGLGQVLVDRVHATRWLTLCRSQTNVLNAS